MNRFEQVLQNAEVDEAVKRRQLMLWDAPTQIVDEEMIYQSRGELLREASLALRSLPPSSKPRVQTIELHGFIPRDIEQHVWMSILRDTLNRFDAGKMTHRQLQVLAVLEEARHEGYLEGSPEEYRFVAEQLGIQPDSAYRRIKLIREKTSELKPKHDIMAVRSAILTLPRVCCVPGCHLQTPRGDRAFCMEHFDYASSLDSYVERWRKVSDREQTYKAREHLKAS